MKKVLIIAFAAAVFTAVSCDKSNQDDPNILKWQGEEYNTMTLANGQTWMTENLHCVPDGISISDDPTAGGSVFYPYALVEDPDNAGKFIASPLKDEESIKKYGLLYDIDAIFGGEVTKDNYSGFEYAQGICPDGWHIPTRAELVALCGAATTKVGSETVAPEDHTAPFWTVDPYDDKSEEGSKYSYGSVKKANEIGWNFHPIGAIMTSKYQVGAIDASKTDMKEFAGYPALTYFASSSLTAFDEARGQCKMASMMTTFTKTSFNETTKKYTGYSLGRLAVADAIMINSNKKAGAISVRCIKNAK